MVSYATQRARPETGAVDNNARRLPGVTETTCIFDAVEVDSPEDNAIADTLTKKPGKIYCCVDAYRGESTACMISWNQLRPIEFSEVVKEFSKPRFGGKCAFEA